MSSIQEYYEAHPNPQLLGPMCFELSNALGAAESGQYEALHEWAKHRGKAVVEQLDKYRQVLVLLHSAANDLEMRR